MKAFDEIYYIDSRKPEAEDILALRLSQLLARYPSASGLSLYQERPCDRRLLGPWWEPCF